MFDNKSDPINSILIEAIFHTRAERRISFCQRKVDELLEGKQSLSKLKQDHSRQIRAIKDEYRHKLKILNTKLRPKIISKANTQKRQRGFNSN